jgi:hypothetical protein
LNCLLSTTYFGPIQWYQKLNRFDCIIDGEEPFIKQTYRNRCIIATTQGVQALTVPVEHVNEEFRMKNEELHIAKNINPSNSPLVDSSFFILHSSFIKDIRISDHGNWRHLHWNALKSAYGESPFFEFYVDDIRPFFEKKWKYLWDFNWEIMEKMCELLAIDDLPLSIDDSHDAPANAQCSKDYRLAIQPKHPQPDPDFTSKPYYQVYQQKHGFIPNLSILDLLFNMGNEAILYLM